MASIVVCHGAWSADWAWARLRPLLRAGGHELIVPCYTGLGARRHLAGQLPITLETHIADVCAVMEMDDLADVVLVGHSYGGFVATGVADRMQARVRQLVYLDAFVPQDGQALVDLVPVEHRNRMLAGARDTGGFVPPQPPPSDTSCEDLACMNPRRFPQPVDTFTTPLHIRHGGWRGPRSYIYCTRPGPGDTFAPFAAEARREPGWGYAEIDASHNPHITAPTLLAGLLQSIMAQAAAR